MRRLALLLLLLPALLSASARSATAGPRRSFSDVGAQPGAQFWCSMHPDQRSDARGTCPICRMALVRMPPAVFKTYPVDLRVTPTLAGARLRLAATHPATPRQGSGQAQIVRKFSIVHERPMHLFLVGDNLEYFAHEHPVPQRDGVFMLDVRLPRPGPYMAIAEFLPEGGVDSVSARRESFHRRERRGRRFRLFRSRGR